MFLFFLKAIVRRVQERNFWPNQSSHSADNYAATNADGAFGEDQLDNGLPTQPVNMFLVISGIFFFLNDA